MDERPPLGERTTAGDIVERALHLWSQPLPEGEAALSRFREVYIDPIPVNGNVTDLQVLADRARMLQSAIDGIRHDLHDFVSTPGRRAFAFTITGRHAGTLTSPLGDVAATGRDVSVDGIDIFTIDEATQQVTAIWAVADWLGLLLELGAIGNDTQR